jgi:hypothetical protein
MICHFLFLKKKVTIRRGGQDKPDRSARFVLPAPPPV